ncbi:MAG: hypothetical protein V1489_00945 [Candidatus Liptonbacteria bacterium]
MSQEEIIPEKLKDYLYRHGEIEKYLGRNGVREILVTDITKAIKDLSKKWFGGNIALRLVQIKK